MQMTPIDPSSHLTDRFRGCLLGHALGDGLGAPFEGLSNETLYRSYGSARKVFTAPPVELLMYTDDTEMSTSVAECLVELGRIDADDLAGRFHRNFNPLRGYGPGMHKIAEAMNLGQDWRAVVETIFPGGSLGNGAAMRVASVGLFFHPDLDRVASEAAASAMITHLHPIGIDGAVMLATAVALILRLNGPFDRHAFLTELSRRATTEEFEWQLRTAAKLTSEDTLDFGNSLEAHRSVTSAILCFAFWPDSYQGAVARAIGLGNDTDTLAAMAGALSGAHLGYSALPAASLKLLEEGPRGKSYIDQLARRLATRFLDEKAVLHNVNLW
jgi:poly(ADP-ribose) glycohydrolase ARH3